ncbi:MAG: homoserine kinase [Candidatus Poribacteria bacterium]|nr:homoserine kinase [Candidatus Poribacteria bacterium]
MPNKATARIPASTTNLGPGFDVLGLALQLYSTVELQEIDSGIELAIHGIDSDKISSDTDNIAYQAAGLVFDRCGYKPKGLRLVLTNGIPAIRGLGGSGTAILGGLLTANAICGEPFSTAALLDFATELDGHPDNVAASLLGGFVVSVMQDNHVHPIKLDCGSDLRVVVAIPDFPLSTKQARGVLPKTVQLADAIYNVSRSSLLVAAIATGNLEALSLAMHDRLHQPYRIPLIPGFDEVTEAAMQAGALSVALSGAGPSIAAYCTTSTQEVAAQMSRAFARHQISCDVKVLSIDSTGATVRICGWVNQPGHQGFG